MKQGKSNKIQVKMILAIYYKDEEDKTVEKIVLRLMEKELESKFLNDEAYKQNYRAIL